MIRLFSRTLAAAVLVALASPAWAQIRVNPNGVNVSTQTATTVFLTYGGLAGYTPVEALWCGALISAAPAAGQRCNPATIYGALPVRYDLSTASGANVLTDVMSVPASVARRAFQDAEAGQSSDFFYVRRFVRPGAPDQFVAVTCRMSGSGARTPLSLVDVQLAFGLDTPVAYVAAGDRLPPIGATLIYTGSGRLQGRWEVVLPGQELPEASDLLSAAALPADQRASQAQYAQVGRFNIFLDPVGRVALPGPDPARLPTGAHGQYFLLLRIEATDEKEGNSDLAAAGAGAGVIRAGGVAGFPMPVLRYVVGTGNSTLAASGAPMAAIHPADGAEVDSAAPVDLVWRPAAGAIYLRLEVERNGQLLHQALLSPTAQSYRLPPFVRERSAGEPVRWRVVAVFSTGQDGQRSSWRRLAFK